MTYGDDYSDCSIVDQTLPDDLTFFVSRKYPQPGLLVLMIINIKCHP